MRLAAALICLIPAHFAAGADWRPVHAGGNEIIEIDTGSIDRGRKKATAWSRVKLGREVKDIAGNYDVIHAQSLYECTRHRYTTLRRAYFRGENPVREEAVTQRRANPVRPGSLDERLMKLACAEADSGQGHAAVKTPEDAADATRPTAMHADLRRADADDGVKIFPVADSATADKPKLIQLPPIDKAALSQAAAAQEAARRAGGEESPGKVAAKPAPAAQAAKPVASGKAEGKDIEALSERRIRELHYANSGPPRSRKKSSATPTSAAAEGGNPAAHLHQHWSYEGETGPTHWARMRADYSACASGRRQSPIDIRDGIRVNLEDIRFDYKPMQFRIVDNGHTVQVNLGEGSSLAVMGKRYQLLQFHFHRPSEERVNGRSYDMSVHLVHRNDEGQLAVVAVLLEKGAEHPLIQTLLNNLPLEQDREMAPEEAIDPSRLLPENRAYWTYMGSLTTPPCTEGVLWMVLKQPLQVGAEQVAIFSRVFRNNARPVQASNGRLIKETR